jgi:hypothetical protein
MLTTHLVIDGEITLQEEGKEKVTFRKGERGDVGAKVIHEAWIGSKVVPGSNMYQRRRVARMSLASNEKRLQKEIVDKTNQILML